MVGGIMNSYSKDQTVFALSIEEAEYHGLAKGMCEGIGMQSLAQNMGVDLKLVVGVDSSAAKAISGRTGPGKARHMEVIYLWCQEMIQKQRARIIKVPGVSNPAGMATKPKSRHEVCKLLSDYGVE